MLVYDVHEYFGKILSVFTMKDRKILLLNGLIIEIYFEYI